MLECVVEIKYNVRYILSYLGYTNTYFSKYIIEFLLLISIVGITMELILYCSQGQIL